MIVWAKDGNAKQFLKDNPHVASSIENQVREAHNLDAAAEQAAGLGVSTDEEDELDGLELDV